MYDFPVSTADRIRKLHSNLSELANQSTCAGQVPSAKNRKRSELSSLSISMKKKGRKNWRSHLLKRGYGVVNSDLTTDLWLCQLGQVLLVFFFRLDFSITLWRYSLELHRFSQYRVTELRHTCIHGCLTHTAGCELTFPISTLFSLSFKKIMTDSFSVRVKMLPRSWNEKEPQQRKRN